MRWGRACIAALILCAAAVVDAAPAAAATLTVTSAADTVDGTCDADCTVQDAFAAANATPGADTITVAAALNGMTLASSAALYAQTEGITLTGNGTANTVIGALIGAQLGGTLQVSAVTVQRPGSGDTLDAESGTVIADGVVLASGGVDANSQSSSAPASMTLSNSTIVTGGINVNTGSSGVTTASFTNVTLMAGGVNFNSDSTSVTTGSMNDVSVTGGGLNMNSGGSGTTTVTIEDMTISGGGLNANSGHLSTTDVTVSGMTVAPNGLNFNSNDTSHTTGDLTDVHTSGGGDLNTNGGGTVVSLADSSLTGSDGDGINQNGHTLSLHNTTVSGSVGDGVFMPFAGVNLTITDSTITGNGQTGINVANGFVGAVTIADTTISGNRTGLEVCSPTTVEVHRSLIAGSTESGVVNDCSSGSLLVSNSTVSGNARGIESGGHTTVVNATITDNSADGVWVWGETTTVTNTIVGDNPASDCLQDEGASLVSGGHNVVTEAAPACGAAAIGDQIVSDALLGALADSGGPTLTHLPDADSPAVDAGSAVACPSVDQRGVSRPQDDDGDGNAVCDVGAVEGAAEPPSITLTGTVRDFMVAHPDFEESATGDDRGIVESTIGLDRKPVYAHTPPASTPTTTGKANFDQWYRDVDGVNLSADLPITLTRTQDNPPLYSYSSSAFFPIDGQLFGNEGFAHNYHFTYELHTRFTYQSGQMFTFSGDDDVWVFINDKLAIDLGGVHGEQTASVDLTAQATTLGLIAGESYDLDLFFAERHTTGSNFRITTSLVLADAPAGTPPIVSAGMDRSGTEGSAISLGGAVTATEGDSTTALWSVAPSGPVDTGATCTVAAPASPVTSVTCNDDGTYIATLEAADGDGEAVDTAVVQVSNVKPAMTVTKPASYSLHERTAPVMAAMTVTDPGSNDTRKCRVRWGDGTAATLSVARGGCQMSHAYTAPGVYPVKTHAFDDDGGVSGVVTRFVVVCKNDIPAAAATITGSAGNDVLCGGPAGDTLAGRGGNDRMFGGRGNDALNGGPGTDSMYGLAGNDTFNACDTAKDHLFGGPGTDVARRRSIDVLNSIERRLRCP